MMQEEQASKIDRENDRLSAKRIKAVVSVISEDKRLQLTY